MDNQVVSSVWKYESKYDLHIDKFLELLLKYGYVWCEQDERDFKINLSNDEKRLLADDFREFQKGLTSFDIAIQVKNIRKLYKKKLLELKQAGTSEKDTIPPWFSKAHSLFSDKTDKENKISNHENISVFLDDQQVTTSDVTTPNIQEKPKKPTSLSPNQMAPSLKSDIVPLTPKRTGISTTTTFSLLHNVSTSLIADSRLSVVGQPVPVKDLNNAKPVLKTTNCLTGKSSLEAISKTSTPSTLENTSTISKLRHSFSQLTSMSPSSRIPMRRSAKSTYGAPMQSTESSNFEDHALSTKSSGVGGPVSHSTTSTFGAPTRSITTSTVRAPMRSFTTATIRAPMRSTTTSTVETPVRSTTSSTFRAPVRSTTSSTFGAPVRSNNAFSVDKSISSPVVKSSTNITDPSPSTISSRSQFFHSKTAPSRAEVSKPQIATSCKTRNLRPVTTMIARSKGPIFMNAQSSPVKFLLRPHEPATTYNRKVPASSSKTRVKPTQIALKYSADVSKLAYPSSSSSASTPAYPSSNSGDSMTTHMPCSSDISSRFYHPYSSEVSSRFYHPYSSEVSTKSYTSSSSGISTPDYPSSPDYASVSQSFSSGISTPAYSSSPDYMSVSQSFNLGISKLAYASSPDYTSVSQSFSLGISPPSYPSSSSGFSTSDYSSSLDFNAAVAPSSNLGISTPAYPSSSLGFHASNAPSSSSYSYKPDVAVSSTADLTSSASSSSTGVLTVASPSSGKDHPVNPSSSSYSYKSAVAHSSTTDFMSSASSSSTGVLTVASPSSGKDILTSDTLYSKDGLPSMSYRSRSPNNVAVPISTVATSSTAEVSFSKNSLSPKPDFFTSTASFSSTGLPLSPTNQVYRSKVASPAVLSSRNWLPLSKTVSCPNTGVPLCPTLATSPTTSLPDPSISPLKYPFSPRKAHYL